MISAASATSGLTRYLPEPPDPPSPSDSYLSDDERRCRKDSDCTTLPLSPCRCHPCKYLWHKAGNKKYAEWLWDNYVREECPPRTCKPCKDRNLMYLDLFLGEKAVCRKHRCIIR